MAILTRASWVKIVLIALLCLVLCGGLIGCSVGCTAAFRHAGNLASSAYDGVNFAERGDFSVPAQDVRSLEINWLAGAVEVVVVDDSESAVVDDAGVTMVSAVEESSGPLRDSLRMSWQLRNGVLQVGYGTELGIFSCSNRNSKRLVLTLPRSVAQSLETVSLSAASGTYVFGPIACEQMSIDLASGRVEGEGLTAKALDLNVASGNIDLAGRFPQALNLDLASGNVEIACEGTCPGHTALNVMSGQMLLAVPEGSGFTAYVDKLSGSFNCDLPGSWNLPSYDVFVRGDGTCTMDVSMASGNVTVREA